MLALHIVALSILRYLYYINNIMIRYISTPLPSNVKYCTLNSNAFFFTVLAPSYLVK